MPMTPAERKRAERKRYIDDGLVPMSSTRVPARLLDRARQLIREFLRSENEKDAPK
jgi:hypothetical protein